VKQKFLKFDFGQEIPEKGEFPVPGKERQLEAYRQ